MFARERHRFTSIEGTVLMLDRWVKSRRLEDLVSEYGRSEAALCNIYNSLLAWLYRNYGHLLKNPGAISHLRTSLPQSELNSRQTATNRMTGVTILPWRRLATPSELTQQVLLELLQQLRWIYPAKLPVLLVLCGNLCLCCN